jgi:hypothetical protein
MRSKDYRNWQPPDRLQPGKMRLGWVDEVISDGERWLQNQPFWSDLDRAENIIRGKEMLKADENRSDLTSNRLKRIGREMVASISDVRYPEDLWTSDNRAYAATMSMFSKMGKAVWYEARAPYSVRRLSQWSLLGGTGYYWPQYRRRKPIDPNSAGMVFEDFGPRDVMPFQLDERNWQETYAVTAIKMMSMYKAHALFPMFADKLRAVPRRRQKSEAVSARMAFVNSLRGDDRPKLWTDQLCEVRYTIVSDLSINRTDMPIPMGDPGASWSYVVPYVGMDIPSDEVSGGTRKMRPATIDDCRMYPNRRLIITASGLEEPAYDGPYWHWHGMIPPKFSSDDWVTEPMGLSVFRDVFDLERARQFTERAIDMKIKAQMDPGMMYDLDGINDGTANEMDPWELRKRLGVNAGGEDLRKLLTTIVPPELMKVGAEPFEWIKYIDESMDYYLGVNAMSALGKAKQNPGGDGADDLLKLAGPIVRDICAGMETPMADVLEMQKYDNLQFFNTARVMSYVGPDGVTAETFDFDPTTVVPSHMPGEDQQGASKFSRQERCKNFARQLRLTPTPGYLHGEPQMAQKLLVVQGWRAGFPLDPARVAKVYGIANWSVTDFPKWKEFKEAEIEFASRMKKEGEALNPGGEAGGGGKPPGGDKKPGRPPSGQKPPAAKTKGSAEGPRTTITES